jgi:hypothetical protein
MGLGAMGVQARAAVMVDMALFFLFFSFFVLLVVRGALAGAQSLAV